MAVEPSYKKEKGEEKIEVIYRVFILSHGLLASYNRSRSNSSCRFNAFFARGDVHAREERGEERDRPHAAPRHQRAGSLRCPVTRERNQLGRICSTLSGKRKSHASAHQQCPLLGKIQRDLNRPQPGRLRRFVLL